MYIIYYGIFGSKTSEKLKGTNALISVRILLIKTIRLWARDFYEVIFDEAKGALLHYLLSITE